MLGGPANHNSAERKVRRPPLGYASIPYWSGAPSALYGTKPTPTAGHSFLNTKRRTPLGIQLKGSPASPTNSIDPIHPLRTLRDNTRQIPWQQSGCGAKLHTIRTAVQPVACWRNVVAACLTESFGLGACLCSRVAAADMTLFRSASRHSPLGPRS